MSAPERDDSRGARISRFGPVAILTIVVIGLAVVLYYPIAMEKFMARYSGVSHVVEPAFEIQVFAQKYDWHFHYAGPDGVFGATSSSQVAKDNPIGLDAGDRNAQDDFVTSELVLPCDINILLKTHSADVIHTLGDVHGAFRVDAIPGVNTDGLLETPASPASGTLRCLTPCGPNHKHHHAPFRFVSETVYESWFETQLMAAQAKRPPPSPQPAR
ncbi:hypothetical protein DES53_102588 [Roseimicrobium gellanilyticum]|uniref:Cytochrome oxidase subunit II copper A binding domain-containing protein n=1 Tax=Roseimicrobium gellanilyticum TaxID=748857 RepID=A0A366HRB6_9BACT|nr:hypothetical protein [Roseimicrobium gellanilyticum]RBP46202.1 hypothetical protein DES53_102588 [Roseimicrobium gellanilyticum]